MRVLGDIEWWRGEWEERFIVGAHVGSALGGGEGWYGSLGMVPWSHFWLGESIVGRIFTVRA